jgi:hypothetical protein
VILFKINDLFHLKMAEKEERVPRPVGGINMQEGSKEIVAIECAVCLQTCVYPVQLPCKHIFCFLCVKGVSLQSKRCAMCRRDIPQDFLQHPELLSQLDLAREETGFEDGGQWFYEGRNGWWLYDERTSQEIENFWSKGEKRCELLIAGLLYIVDFEQMLQFRRNDPSRRRRIKRDAASGPKKGVAGIRIEGGDESSDIELSDEIPGVDRLVNDSNEDEEGQDSVNDLHLAMQGLSVAERGIVTRVELQSSSESNSQTNAVSRGGGETTTRSSQGLEVTSGNLSGAAGSMTISSHPNSDTEPHGPSNE